MIKKIMPIQIVFLIFMVTLTTLSLKIDAAAAAAPNREQVESFWFAVRGSNMQAIQQLLKRNINLINLQDRSFNTALMFAIEQKNQKMAKLFIVPGANLDLKNNNGMTALMLAINNQDQATAELLINAGANLDLKNNDGMTALMLAIQLNLKEIIAMLIYNGANLDLQDNYGNTALMLALNKTDYDSANALIDNDAKLNVKNKYGDTALSIAILRKDTLAAWSASPPNPLAEQTIKKLETKQATAITDAILEAAQEAQRLPMPFDFMASVNRMLGAESEHKREEPGNQQHFFDSRDRAGEPEEHLT